MWLKSRARRTYREKHKILRNDLLNVGREGNHKILQNYLLNVGLKEVLQVIEQELLAWNESDQTLSSDTTEEITHD